MNDTLQRLLQRSFTSENSIRPRRSPGFIRVQGSAAFATAHTATAVDSTSEQPAFAARSVTPNPHDKDGTTVRTQTPGNRTPRRAPLQALRAQQATSSTTGSEAKDRNDLQDDTRSSPRERTWPAAPVRLPAEAEPPARMTDSLEDQPERRITAAAESRWADHNVRGRYHADEGVDTEARSPDSIDEHVLEPSLRPATVEDSQPDPSVSGPGMNSSEQVQISIGSVEIRFPEAATAAEPQETEPRMTLGDYLDRQSKRKR